MNILTGSLAMQLEKIWKLKDAKMYIFHKDEKNLKRNFGKTQMYIFHEGWSVVLRGRGKESILRPYQIDSFDLGTNKVSRQIKTMHFS